MPSPSTPPPPYLVEVSIIADDEGVLTPQLKHHGGQPLSSRLHHLREAPSPSQGGGVRCSG